MKIEKTESNWLSGKKAHELEVTELLILSEPEQLEKEYQGKKSQKTVCKVQAGSNVFTWEMNQTTANSLVDAYGGETKDWIGKTIPIETSISSNGNRAIFADVAKLPNQKATSQAKITA